MFSFIPTRVGDPVLHGRLAVFPIFADVTICVDYVLADEAISSGAIKVEEISSEGSVPNLLVENQSETLVLFLEGEELKGARQNRVLNTSLLAPAKSRTSIPVSCVEQGRWRYISRHFGSSGHYSSSKMRHLLRKAVTRSTEVDQSYRSDQAVVWREVARQSEALGTTSPTGAMSDTYVAYGKRLAEFEERLKYVEGAIGVAASLGKRVLSVDLFDKSSTCRKIWSRLLGGMILEALEPASDIEVAATNEVQKLLTAMQVAAWQQAPVIGAGDAFRAKFADDSQATALVVSDTVVHGSMVTAA